MKTPHWTLKLKTPYDSCKHPMFPGNPLNCEEGLVHQGQLDEQQHLSGSSSYIEILQNENCQH